MAELRVGIVGYGLAGRVFHGQLIAATDGLRVAAIVTSDPGRAGQAALDHPQAELYKTVAALWERAGELDAVVVATANDAHVPLATEAIDRGLPVVVDKPLAPSADAAEALVAHAEETGVLLTVFQNRRWDSDQLLLSEVIESGGLGTVWRHESRLERWRPQPEPGRWRDATPPAQGGGQLLDLGSHLVDQALHRFGPATHVYAEVDSRRGLAGDDDVFIALTHAGGVISHLRASVVTAAPGPRLRVLGSEAALIVPEPDTQEDRLRAGERPDLVEGWGVEPTPSRPRLIAGERSVPLTGPPGDWPAFYALFRDAVRSGGPPPVDPRDALAALRVLDAARTSASTRAVVELGSPRPG
jgi:scyllo-inositol 2-dehydrogenase (NADP+)